MASQVAGNSTVSSTVSGTHQGKHQSSASLAIVRGSHLWRENSPHKWPVRRKTFPFHDVIMVRWNHGIYITKGCPYIRIMIRSDRSFPYAMTNALLWYVRTCDLVGWLKAELEPISFSRDLIIIPHFGVISMMFNIDYRPSVFQEFPVIWLAVSHEANVPIWQSGLARWYIFRMKYAVSGRIYFSIWRTCPVKSLWWGNQQVNKKHPGPRFAMVLHSLTVIWAWM